MKNILLTLSLLIPSITFGQTFSVESKDNKSREFLMEKIKDEGLALNLNNSDYTLELVIEGEYNPVSIKRTHQGYLVAKDKSGSEIARSKSYKTTPAAINGYNASYQISKKIVSKELVTILRKCKPIEQKQR